MKKLLTCLLSIAVVFSLLTPAFATSGSDSLTVRQEQEYQSNLEYTSLIGSFWADYDGGYPDYYAGAYINDDGRLVVQVCQVSDDIISDVQQRTGNNSVTIEEAKYSYNTLISLKNHVTRYVSDHPTSEITAMLSSATICDDTNNLEIGVVDTSVATTNAILDELFPISLASASNFSSAISFVQEDKVELPAPTAPELESEDSQQVMPNAASNTLYAGDKITTSSRYNLSVGFPCRRKLSSGAYEYGFVTAAHGCAKGDSVSYNGTVIGTVTEWKLDGRIDCAFVKMTNTNYTFPHYVNLYYEDTGTSQVYPVSITTNIMVSVGSTVYKDGFKTNTTEGTVKSVNTDVFVGGNVQKTITDLIKTSPMTDQGDSGGLGFVIGSDATTLKTSAIKFGLVEADSDIWGIKTASYFVNYSYIYSDMPVYAYQLQDAPW